MKFYVGKQEVTAEVFEMVAKHKIAKNKNKKNN